jgi:hypothetical protein
MSAETEATDTTVTRRLRLPRFGLRALFVFAILFCLLFGWIGRNLYRMRQEDAAIETLKRAGASVYVRTGGGVGIHPDLPWLSLWTPRADRDDLPSLPARATGLAGPYPVRMVDLKSEHTDDPLQDEALAALATFPEIEFVHLEGAAFDDDSLAFAARLPKLISLILSRTKITGEGLAILSRSQALAHLSLDDVYDNSDLVAGLSSLPRLTSIQLRQQSVSREDMATIAAMPDLRRLAITHVTLEGDDVFLPLAKANSIRDFWLVLGSASRPLTESDVQAIVALPNLRVLTLEDFDPAYLERLHAAPSLAYLHLVGPETDRTGAQAFSEARPGCLVSYTKGVERLYFLDGESLDQDAGFELSETIQER